MGQVSSCWPPQVSLFYLLNCHVNASRAEHNISLFSLSPRAHTKDYTAEIKQFLCSIQFTQKDWNIASFYHSAKDIVLKATNVENNSCVKRYSNAISKYLSHKIIKSSAIIINGCCCCGNIIGRLRGGSPALSNAVMHSITYHQITALCSYRW